MDDDLDRAMLGRLQDKLRERRNLFQYNKDKVAELDNANRILFQEIGGLERAIEAIKSDLGITDNPNDENDLESNSDVNKTDMVLTIIKNSGEKGITVQGIIVGLRTLGVGIADSYVRTILSRLMEKEVINRESGHYFAIPSEFIDELKSL